MSKQTEEVRPDIKEIEPLNPSSETQFDVRMWNYSEAQDKFIDHLQAQNTKLREDLESDEILLAAARGVIAVGEPENDKLREAIKGALQMMEQILVYREANKIHLGITFLKSAIHEAKEALKLSHE